MRQQRARGGGCCGRSGRTGTALERLRGAVETMLPIDRERRQEWQVWVAVWGEASKGDSLSAGYRRGWAGLRDDVRRAARGGAARRSSCHADIDIEHRAERLVTLLAGIGLLAGVERPGRVREMATRMLAEELAWLGDPSRCRRAVKRRGRGSTGTRDTGAMTRRSLLGAGAALGAGMYLPALVVGRGAVGRRPRRRDAAVAGLGRRGRPGHRRRSSSAARCRRSTRCCAGGRKNAQAAARRAAGRPARLHRARAPAPVVGRHRQAQGGGRRSTRSAAPTSASPTASSAA